MNITNNSQIFEQTNLERWWTYFIERNSIAYVTTIGTFLIHEIFYFFVSIPFWIVDFIPSLQKYKLQPEVKNDYNYQKKGWQRVILTHFCVQLPMMLLFHEIFMKKLEMKLSLPLPSWFEIVNCCIFSLIIEDFYFYWMHRFLHMKQIYKHIHKVHHEFASPFGFAAEYAHPIETVLLGVGTVIGPMIMATHFFTVLVWLFIRLLQTVEAHSGYDFPWSPRHFIPFWGGSEFHDFHHETSSGNYSSTFTVWDRVFGTDLNYKKRKQQRLMKKTE